MLSLLWRVEHNFPVGPLSLHRMVSLQNFNAEWLITILCGHWPCPSSSIKLIVRNIDFAILFNVHQYVSNTSNANSTRWFVSTKMLPSTFHVINRAAYHIDLYGIRLYAEVGIVTKKCNFVIRYSVTQKSYSVTPLQKVTEFTVTPLLRYFYKIKS